MSGPVVWVKYTISLLGCHAYDRTPYVHNTRKGAVQFLADRRASSRGWKKFISLEQVNTPGSSLLHDGGLLIRCTVSMEADFPFDIEKTFNNEGIERRVHGYKIFRTLFLGGT